MIWVLEDVFPTAHTNLFAAVEQAGQKVVPWQSAWEGDQIPSAERVGMISTGRTGAGSPIVFHGSLGNATRLDEETDWKPGAFCDVRALTFSAWASAELPLLNEEWSVIPLAELVRLVELQDAKMRWDRIFIRPDSPLKQFAGRVLDRDRISFKSVDFGYYFDDPNLPVVIAPEKEIVAEWRYVVIGRKPVACSGYDPVRRTATEAQEGPDSEAERVADTLPSTVGEVFVMDLCETKEGEIKLLELNPFSGADLYLCDGKLIVKAMWEHLDGMT